MAILNDTGIVKSYNGKGLRIGIVHARWNSTIIDALLDGTKKALAQAGVEPCNITVQSVPGSYELPYAVKQLYDASQGHVSKKTSSSQSMGPLAVPFDAIVAIGVLIKGESMHFEYISDAVSHGLMRLQLDSNIPIVFGLLTLLNQEQGMWRAGIAGYGKNEGHNHGLDWGRAAVELGVKRKGWARGDFIE